MKNNRPVAAIIENFDQAGMAVFRAARRVDAIQTRLGVAWTGLDLRLTEGRGAVGVMTADAPGPRSAGRP